MLQRSVCTLFHTLPSEELGKHRGRLESLGRRKGKDMLHLPLWVWRVDSQQQTLVSNNPEGPVAAAMVGSYEIFQRYAVLGTRRQ